VATLQELFDLRSNTLLRNRVAAACDIAADAIRSEASATENHANRLIWAKMVLSQPFESAGAMLREVLAANAALTLAQITAASDAALQAAVNAAVNLFATGS
jgi:hypothetical protein